MTQYVKPALLILVPFLIGIGKIIKSLLLGPATGWITRLIQRILKTTSRIPYLLWTIGVCSAIVYGFITSTYNGLKLCLDAIIATGLIQGSVVAWTAMGLYDTARKKE